MVPPHEELLLVVVLEIMIVARFGLKSVIEYYGLQGGGARERVWPFVAAAAYFGAISSKVVSVPPKARIPHFDISNNNSISFNGFTAGSPGFFLSSLKDLCI